MNIFEKLKTRWGVKSNFQLFIIFVVFAITGSSSLKVGRPVLDYLNITDSMNAFIYWPLRIIIILPIYQVLLIFFGTILGQFRFFWEFEKKMFGRFMPKKKIVATEEIK